MIYYKIRHKSNGLFSQGGSYVSADGTNSTWHKKGKTWTDLRSLRSHITNHLGNEWRSGTDMSEWEVISYEMVEVANNSIYDMINPKKLIEMLKQ